MGHQLVCRDISSTMKIVLLLCFVGFAASNPGLSLTEVIAAVIADTDIDNNGIVSEAEFRNELLSKWDSDVPSDDIVSKHDFVNQWTKRYNDNHQDASTFFDNLDSFFPFGQLSEADLLFHMGSLDPDGDGQVS